MSGVKISQPKFLIYTSFHHRFLMCDIGHRYLLVNLHVIQFQYGLELLRLSYPQFCTDSPEDHLMEPSSLIIKFRPILYQIPEHYRYEE